MGQEKQCEWGTVIALLDTAAVGQENQWQCCGAVENSVLCVDTGVPTTTTTATHTPYPLLRCPAVLHCCIPLLHCHPPPALQAQAGQLEAAAEVRLQEQAQALTQYHPNRMPPSRPLLAV